MSTQLYFNPFIPAFSNTGVAIGGAQLHFFVSGTLTRADIFSDKDMSVPLPNPVIADIAGKYPDIYLDENIVYRVMQLDSNGNTIGDDIDPYIPGSTGGEEAIAARLGAEEAEARTLEIEARTLEAEQGALAAEQGAAAQVTLAATEASNAASSATVASTAVLSSLLGGNLKADIAEGLADTVDGEFFYVTDINGDYVEYENVSGAEVATGLVVVGPTKVNQSVDDVNEIQAVVSLIQESTGIDTTIYSAPFHDDFIGDGQLQNRDNWTVIARDGTTTTHLDDINIVNGRVGGDGGFTFAFGVHDAGGVDAWIDRVRALPLGGLNVDHVQVTGTRADYMRANAIHAVLAGLQTGNLTINKVVQNVNTNIPNGQLAGLRLEPFDNVQHRYSTVNGTTSLNVYVNGRLASEPIVVSGQELSLSGLHGLGDENDPETLEEYNVGLPASQACLSLFQTAKVVQTNADGSATWTLSGDYTQGRMSSLRYTLFNASDDTPVMGHDNVLASNFSATDTTYSATFTASAASLSGGGPYYVVVSRSNLIDSDGNITTSRARGPVQYLGDTVVYTGQSLGVQASRQTLSSITNSAMAGSLIHDGEPALAENRRRSLPITDNTAQAAFAAAASEPVGYGSGGLSATNIATRGVGSETYLALVDTIKRVGAQNSVIVHVDGQSDSGDADAYKSGMITHYEAIRAIYPNIKVMIIPIAIAHDLAANLPYQEIRRVQWQLCQERPDIFTWGPHMMDLQHLDSLHVRTETSANELGYSEFNRRVRFMQRKMVGKSSVDRNGPEFLSMQRIDAQTLRCTYALNDFENIALLNSSHAGEHHGGMSFAASNDFASLIFPTGHSVGAVSGGEQTIDFTFSSNSFPGGAFARALFGANPINPTNDSAINDQIIDRASMIVGQITGEPNVGLQPYFSGVIGTSFVSA